MIVLDEVTKRYGHKAVLDKVSFEVEGGEFVSIVGPSGAGKTTLIHLLIGAEKLTSGSIVVDHYYVNKLNRKAVQEYRRQIGIVYQDYKLLPKKTVFENVALALEVAGYPDHFIQKRTTEILKLTGLEEQRNHFPGQLSGGESQRTSIARALVHAPELLICDEPTGNLDPDSTLEVGKLLQKINRGGTTVLLATHDKDIVDMVKQRVITIKNGKLASDRKNATYK
jgi:cell division transport system ATP-binding protein